MRKVIAIILMFIGIGMMVAGIKIFVNDELTVFEEDKEEVIDIIKTKKNILNYDDINAKVLEQAYKNVETKNDYDADEVKAWKSGTDNTEVYLLTFKDANSADNFFNSFLSQFKLQEKKYDDYRTATYKFGGVIDRYCYKVVSDKYAIYLLSYDKNEYDSIINHLAFDK